jgi:hypothetical protein
MGIGRPHENPMRSLIPVAHIEFTARSRVIFRAAGKIALLLFSTAVVLIPEAVRGQSAPDGFNPTANLSSTLPAQAINFSTRILAQTGDNVGIGGFTITGTSPKHVLLRALGPSLTQFGVLDALADPTLELHGPVTFIATKNDNWQDDPAQKAAILADGIPPSNNLESAIDATLPPGAYTALVTGKNNTSGVALVEVYDLNQSVDSKLANLSTRAFVDTGNNILIAGFVLGSNSGNDRVVVCGIGPTLTEVGVTNALADPTLELRNSNGAILVANNDWQDDSTQAAELTGAGLAPGDTHESGVVAALPPGRYTALLTGLNNGTGLGLVEVYNLGAPVSPPPVASTVTRTQAGNSAAVEMQHVAFDSHPFSGTFRISVYHPPTINHSDIGARAALHGQTAPISFTASAADIVAALKAVPNYYAYGQFGNLEFGPGAFSYFAGQGAINRDPIVTLDTMGGIAAGGFTIQFGSLVGSPTAYNTWVTGMPLVTIAAP